MIDVTPVLFNRRELNYLFQLIQDSGKSDKVKLITRILKIINPEINWAITDDPNFIYDETIYTVNTWRIPLPSPFVHDNIHFITLRLNDINYRETLSKNEFDFWNRIYESMCEEESDIVFLYDWDLDWNGMTIKYAVVNEND